MVIPDKLTLILERLFGSKLKYGRVLPPNYHERVLIYKEALEYVEKDLRLFSYVLGHRRIVSLLGSCKFIDDVILECVCRDPRIIPQDFRTRMPKGSSVTVLIQRLYMRDKEYKTLTQEPLEYQLAAE